VALGIGINVDMRDFPDEIAGIATSMYLESGGSFDLRSVLDSVLRVFGPLYDQGQNGETAPIISRYKDLCLNIGRTVILTKAVTGERVTGTAFGVDDGGGLIIRLPDGGEYTARSGEISLREYQ
jgi:BirA family biotin operon repressor/biotin-[acetyl-CoA-carboxylase] ligase